MANNETADQEIGVLANQLPNILTVNVSVEGILKNLDQNSLLGVRVDFEVNGEYTKSLLLHGTYKGVDVFNAQRNALMPWGTKKKADRVLKVNDFSKFNISLKENAPPNWKGKAHISFIMQNAGVGTRAKIILRKG
jgi:hypothetical protein